jgi:Ni,Fe-hydrogenase III small subunit
MHLQKGIQKHIVFRPGRPVISTAVVDEQALTAICPTGAITAQPIKLDLGKCNFCEQCAMAFPAKIKFTSDTEIAANERGRLIVEAGNTDRITLNASQIRKKVADKLALKLLALYPATPEAELNASILLELELPGIEFVTDAAAATGIIILGEITADIRKTVDDLTTKSLQPKVIILAGREAISGNDAAIPPAIPVDLFIPGSPVHPVTLSHSIQTFIRTAQEAAVLQ